MLEDSPIGIDWLYLRDEFLASSRLERQHEMPGAERSYGASNLWFSIDAQFPAALLEHLQVVQQEHVAKRFGFAQEGDDQLLAEDRWGRL